MVLSYGEGGVMGLGCEGSGRSVGRYMGELVKGTSLLVMLQACVLYKPRAKLRWGPGLLCC